MRKNLLFAAVPVSQQAGSTAIGKLWFSVHSEAPRWIIFYKNVFRVFIFSHFDIMPFWEFFSNSTGIPKENGQRRIQKGKNVHTGVQKIPLMDKEEPEKAWNDMYVWRMGLDKALDEIQKKGVDPKWPAMDYKSKRPAEIKSKMNYKRKILARKRPAKRLNLMKYNSRLDIKISPDRTSGSLSPF